MEAMGKTVGELNAWAEGLHIHKDRRKDMTAIIREPLAFEKRLIDLAFPPTLF
ncbi:hypothetical protein BCR42DRAFT_437297 [Absidia repens]|uniref:Uncharacterized protein n=1 Tax=Absidia repens TaxID=90262 RepID=A0A1X2IIU7_9FUNG|nr:hypothetical protein BCR42DRAFT_437297 [Absidia repens]